MNELTYQKLAEIKERHANADAHLGLAADLNASKATLERSHTDIPLLITEIDRQRKEIEELKKFEARCKWLEEHGDPQFIYEEGRPHIGVPIIRIDNWHEGECVADTVSEAVDRAISLTAESEGEK